MKKAGVGEQMTCVLDYAKQDEDEHEIKVLNNININKTYRWKQTKSPAQWESLSQSPWQFGRGFGGAPRALKVCWSGGNCSLRWAVVLSAAAVMLPPKKEVERMRMALCLMIIVLVIMTAEWRPAGCVALRCGVGQQKQIFFWVTEIGVSKRLSLLRQH